ncbi:MAG: PD40 domain-containing protein [Verrucomicrobia bacterium]|nr:PD40 domain-containing protein [Verrucomicrobiota bacterium]
MKSGFRNFIGAGLALLAATAAHAAADLAITAITASPVSVLPGESVTFTVTLTNNASSTLNGAATTLNDYNGGTGHIGLTLTSTTATSIVLGSQSVTIPSITAGSTGSVTVSFTVPTSYSQAGTYFASAKFGFAPGSTATGTATLSAAVTEVVLTAFGSGYTSAPTVSFTGGGGGSGAAGTAIVANGAVIAVHLTAAGSGYTSAPTVSFTGGGGSGATATAQIVGSVASIAVAGAGSGYGNTPDILISGGAGGSGAAASLSRNAATTGVGTVTVTNAGGSGYTSAPTVSFSGGGGTGAAATATISGAISSVTINSGGAGYTSPTVSFVGGGGGSGAAATATVTSGAISAITITSAGSGYASAPTVVLSEAGSTPASLSAVITSSVSSITVTSAGSNYTSAPTVSFTGGGGSGATASAQLSGSAGSFTVSAGGSNYTSTPTVTVVGGGTSGATTYTSSFATPSTVVTVTGTPDFQITAVNYPAGIAYKGGDVIPMSLTYRNNTSSNGSNNVPFVPSGSGGATYFRVQVILSSDPVFNTTAGTTSDDFVLTFFDVPITRNADSVNHTYSWNQLLPGNFPGSYYVLARIDSLDAVTETIENDLTQNGNNIWQDVNATRIALLPTNFPTMYLASVNPATSASGNNYSDNPSITADGRYVAFASDATDLITSGTDTNGERDIFLYDNQTSTVRRLNVSQQGAEANAASATPAISGNGSYVAFSSEAANLVLGDNNGFSDIFVVNTLTGAIARVSVPHLASQGTLGTQANGSSFRPAISYTGRYVVFESNATNLVSAGTTTGVTHLYLHDRDADNNGTFDETSAGGTTTVLVSQSTGGTQGNGNSLQAAISAGGGYIAFATDATNLGGTVTSGLRNIYVRDVSGGTTTLVSFASGPAAANASSRAPSINQNNGAASDGRYIAFASEATNLVAGDTNGVSDVFIWDRNSAATPAVRVSTAPSGGQPLDPLAAPFTLGSFNPSISATGRYVAFASTATNLVPGDGIGAYGVLAAATVSGGAVTAVGVTNPGNNYYSSGTTPNPGGIYYSTVPTVTISGGGGSGATATAVLSGTTTGTITSITVTAGGSGYTSTPTVTVNGSFNQALHVYTMDRDVSGSGTFGTAGNLALSRNSVNRFGYESIRLIGVQSSAAADIYPVISGDGRWIAIPSDADTTTSLGNTTTNLINADTNAKRDVFLHDRRINALPSTATLPTVTITSPGSGGSALVNSAISLTASATTTTGVISSVQFFVNGTSVGTSSIFPYTATWTPTAVGTYTLSALTTDSFGNIGVSSNLSVTINAAPSVGITAPTAGTLVSVNVARTVSASASATTPGATISSVQFYANGVSIGTDTTSPYSVSWTPATSGTYSLTAVATDSSSVQTTSAAVSVSAGTAPSVSITSPATSSTVSVNSTQTILASASSTNGTIASVQFFANGVSLGTDSVFPFTATWTPASTGLYSLTAIATDNVGNTTTSSIISVTVTGSAAPTISITSPTASSTVAFAAPTTITVNAASTVGSIASVQFFNGATSLGTVTTAPFSLSWTPTTAGAASLTAVATDSIGVTTTSAAVSVTVGSGPTVTLTSPTTGSTVSVNTATTLLATASANVSGASIASVQFLANGTAVGTATSVPFSVAWTPTVDGTYSLTARATDTAGNVTTSTAASVTVSSAATAPAVSITSPAASATLGINAAITLTATTSTPVGTVTSVQYLANGSAIGTATAAPFSLSWTPSSAGAVSLTAVVTNSLGSTTTSSAVSVTVGAAPTVAVTAPASLAINSSGSLTATATANASGATIASVQFLANGVAISTDTSFPYAATFTPTATGTYSITAVATDTRGNQATSSAASVVVASANTAPTGVAITAPAASSTINVGTATTVTATATDADGAIASVQFFANGTAVGTATASPYSITWTPTLVGSYNLTVTATDNLGATTSTSGSPVAVTVGGASAPAVSISVGTSLAIGGTRTITATPTTTGTLTVTNVQFFANGTSLGTDTTFPYTLAWTPTTTGTYAITATVTDSAGNQATSSATNVTVSSTNTAPTGVALTAPAASFSSGVGTAVTVTATATDNDGAIAGVQFFANGTSIGTVTTGTSPYSLTWTPTLAGSYALHVVATDNLGATTSTSGSPVNGTIGAGNAPTAVSITAPAASANLPAGQPVTVTGTATPATGFTIANLEFFVQVGSATAVSLGVDSAFPYTASWTPTATGAYTLTAIATDSAGNRATSSSVAVNVITPAAPTVSLTSPAAGATVNIGTTTTIAATAADSDGTVQSVQFFVNGTALSTDVTSPYTATWTPTVAGSYALTAVATDNLGTTTTSSSVTVTASGGNAPTVAITAPGNATTVPVNSANTITATATAASGLTIASVQFLANGVSLGTDTTFPYSAPWTPAATGSYSLTALATDSAGNQATSTATTVTVSSGASGLPVVSVVTPPTGTTVTVNQPLIIAANASDPDGTVANVEFVVNNVVVGGKASAPYFALFTPTAAGALSITAVVTDNAGNRVTSTAATVTVAAASGTPPTVALFYNEPGLDAPNASTTAFTEVDVSLGSKLILTAIGSSASGTIASAQFFVNGTSIGTDNASPFYTTHTVSTLGQIALTALVTDSLGNAVFTTPVFLRSRPSTLAASSVVTLVSPQNGASYTVGENIVFNATHSFGTTVPTSVDFYLNGIQATTVTSSPYQFIRSLTTAGNYDVHAVARTGTVTTLSSVATISVTSNSAPTVSLTSPTTGSTTAIGTPITIEASASDTDGTIRSVQFFANGVALENDTTFPYGTVFNPTATGVYQLRALATDNAGNQTLSTVVSVTVTAGTAPTVALTAPANGSSVAVGSAVTVTASATANATGATIASVQFFANGISLGGDTTFPYGLTFTPAATGSFALTAQATDTAGNQSTSATVTITVSSNTAPTVSLSAPANASTVGVGAATTVTATATDADGTIQSVQFFVSYNNGTATSLGTVTSSPYSVTWTPRLASPAGVPYVLTAVATDNLGATTTSSAISVTVAGGNAPTGVAVTAPAGMAVNTTAAITATATAVGGTPPSTIASVQFFANGVSLGTDTTFPYAAGFTPTATGSYSITALATDTAGNQTASAASTVTVSAGGASPPTVAISSPTAGSSITVNTTSSIAATATANASGATIGSVQFFANGVALGTDATFPYSVSFTPTATGTYTLTATAVDTAGNQATSAGVAITVAAPGGTAPTVAVTSPTSGSAVAVNNTQTITASATASTGTIASVEFFANGTAIGGPDIAFPYSVSWTPVALGNYALTAVATDTAGNRTTSAAATVNVVPALPTVSITSPTNGADFPVDVTRNVTAGATSPGTVTSVQFFANGVSLGTATSSPYSRPWTPTATGNVELTATVIDSFGTTVTSSIVRVTVGSPTVSVTGPTAGSSIPVNVPQTVTGTATSAAGTITSVEFFANGVSIGTDATAPYSVSWTPNTAGAVNLTMTATDSVGNKLTSFQVAIAVSSGAVTVGNSTLNASGISGTPATTRPGDAVAFGINVTNSAASTVPAGANNFPAGATANATITLTNLATGYSFALTGNFLAAAAISEGGQTGVLTSTLTIPQQFTEAGAYRATVNINSVSSGFVGTSSFTAATAVITIAGTPDLQITGLTYAAGTSYKGGDVIPMSLTYVNRSGSNGSPNVPWVGSAPGNGSFYRISVVLSTNPVFGDADDFGLSFFDNSAKLNADNATQTISWNQILPGNYAGSYYVLAKIDSLDTNAETVENDLTQNGNNIWLDVNAPRIAIQPSNFPTTYLVSSTPNSGPSGNGHSDNPITSADGRYTVFASDASNLVVGDSNSQRDIFLYDNQTAAIRRLNLSQQGAQANGPSNNPTITANGRYVAFESAATNLVLGDTNGFSDIFVVDTLTGAITRVSVTSGGAQANSSSFRPSISSNGRFVAFESPATNLDAAANVVGVSQIFVHDRDVSGSGTLDNAVNISTALVSRATGGAGAAGSAHSTQPRISGDGSYIAFASDATNLVVGDTNALRDIFLRDRTGLTTTRVSVATGGTQATGGASRSPSLSDDGRYIAFASDATNLVVGDTNGVSDVFVHDRTTTTTVRVSVTSAGAQAADPSAVGAQLGSLNPSISATGRYVAFASLANNLTSGSFAQGRQSATDSNGALDVFVHDRDVSGSGTFDTAGNIATTMASVNKFGYQTIGVLGSQSTSSSDIYPSISGDGRWIAFPSDAENASGLSHTTTNLITQDSNQSRDVFLFDRRINAVPGAGTPPTVSITSPVTANPYPVNSAISIVGNASATTGTVASVQFFANGTSLGTDTTFPYTATWTPTATGTFVLSALVTDSFGNLGVSPNVAITINPVSTNVPVVNITSPIAGATIVVNSTTTVNATATDPDGTIASVEFFANGVSLGVDTVFPYEAPWTPTATGTYTLTALATDNGGNQTTSAGVAVTAFARPTVAMTAPPVGSSHVVNTATTVTATASTAVVGGSIVSVQFFDNGVAFGTDTTAPFSVSWTPTTTGSHALTATATDNQGNQTTTPALTIAVISSLNGAPPVVSITSPTSGSAVGIGVATTVAATATDSDGSVTSVQFFVNGVSIGTDTTAPFTATWTPGAAGAFNVTAVATDNINNTTTSTPVSVNVSAAPTVAFTTPAAGATLAVNTPVNLAATASDTDGVIASVSFSVAPVGGTSVTVGTDTVFPYTGTWTPAAAGTYTLTATAIDNVGTQSTATRNVTVTSGTAPTVAISAPAAGATLAVNSTTSVTATASAVAPATIASVQFFANGVSLGTDTTFPYAVPFTPAAEGTYNLTALATDTSGNQTNSAAVSVTVAAGAPPTVAIGAPTTGTTVPVNSANTVTATATAVAPATIASVQFFANGTSLGTDTTFPYAASWTPTATGTYLLTAVATDSSGASATSASTTITVTGGAAPTVAITSPAAAANLAVNTATTITANATAAVPAPGVTPATIASVQFFANGVSIGTDASAPYSIVWTPTAAGTYLLTAIATDTAGNAATSSALSVSVSTATTLPVATLVAPVAGSTTRYTQGTGVVLAATATDFDGTVANVRFFANDVLVGAAVSSAPYVTVWTPNATGTYTIKAIATDNQGNESSPVTATVNIVALVGTGTVPTVSLSTPVTALTTRSTIPINAGLSSSAINQVTFYDNGVQIAVVNASPYAVNYSPTSPGLHRLYAVASDSATPLPNVVVSPLLDVVVTAATSPQAPSPVTLTTSATPGVPVQIGGTPAAKVNFTVDASDPDGFVKQVQFLVNGVPVGTVSAFPYTLDYTPTALTTYIVTALATDDAGNISTSAPVSFTTTPAGAPTVNITTPLAGGTVSGGVPTTITATVVPAPGRSILATTNVKFLVGGVELTGTVTSPALNTYSITWVPPNAGTTLDLTARATDNQNVTGVSPVVTVNLTATLPPQANITSPASSANLTVGIDTVVKVAVTFVAPGLSIKTAQLFINNIPQTPVDNPGLSFDLPIKPTTAVSNVSLTVRVTDNNGGVTTTSQVLVNFVNLPGPSVAISAPASGSSIVIGTATTVTATATPVAAGSTIKQVRFYAGSDLIGTVSNAAPGTVNLSTTWLPIKDGNFPITAIATDSNDNTSTSPAANVAITRTPATVRIDSPTNGSTINVNTPQTIAATAETTTGTVTRVDFMVNGVLLASDTTFPFSVPWTPVTPGTFALTAVSTDNFGTATTSPVITVTVAKGSVPTVSLLSPPSGATVKVGNVQTLVASATAASGTIKQIEFFANNVSLGSPVAIFPYNFAWTPTAPGSYSLYAIATDTLGNQAASAAVTVTVAAVSPGAPSVAIASPASGASLPVGVAANIAATATDADGTIVSVEFFANDKSLGVDNVFPYNFAFTPNATGSYVLTAKATDNGGNFTTSAPVTITVSGGTAPSVAISSPVGGSTLGVNVPQTIKADATSSSGFISSVQFFLNGVPLATDTSFPYATPWTPGAVGTYVLTARATDNLGNITDSAPVTIVIGASAAPTVSITNPAAGSSYTVGAALTISADAVDSDGTITQVAFFVNGAPQGAVDTVSPYNVPWAPGSPGNYTITAQATDNNGNVTTSTPVTVVIGANAPPTVALTSPTAGLSYGLGTQVLIAATASDSDGSVTNVQFLVNSLVVGTVNAPPYNLSWRPTFAGTFSITAVATDNVGNVTTSAARSVTITASGAPAVTFTNPVAGASFGVGTTIPVAATTTGGNGPVAQVQFFVNGTPLGGADTTAPYSATWTPGAPGTYSLLAVATDSAGISSNSPGLSVVINANNAPTVAITNPATGVTVNGGSIVNLAASATDSDGTIATVNFLANGNAIGSATASPYIVPWTPTAAGAYTVVAQAVDNSGNVTNSTSITVNVSANQAPTVRLSQPSNGSVVRTGSQTTIVATATDADGVIASVQFFANSVSIGAPVTAISSQGGYRINWTPQAEGIYRLTAVALDNSGAATTSGTFTVMAISQSTGGADTVFTGTYQQGLGEQGIFALIAVRGKSATFIGYTTTSGITRTFYFPGLTLDASGGFAAFDTVGRPLIQGSTSLSGVSGTLDNGRLTFIGIDTAFFPATGTVAAGAYSGSFNDRPNSTVAAIVGYDASIYLYAGDGVQAAASGKVDAAGNFNLVANVGGRFIGKADPATGFLTGTFNGANGGAFIGATASGVSFSDGFLKNLSTRGVVGSGADMLIAGFVVGGTSPKQVLIRAVGPTLASFGVTGALADPQLQILSGTSIVTTNDNWGGSPAIVSAAASVGAFPLPATSRDSAVIALLQPGAYTAQVSGIGGTTGVALMEIYDVDNQAPFSAQKIMNLATRGTVTPGQGLLVAGFVVSGNTSKKLLIRGVGPSLAGVGISSGFLADPVLKIVKNSDNSIVRENDNWETGNDTSSVADASQKVGAFNLAAGGKDAVILINLPPGGYSAQVSGANNGSGIALIEVYEVP